MYSVILAALLASGGQQAQSFHPGFGSSCYGCSGCSGCSGCQGGSGCHGGGIRYGSHFGRGCHGCGGCNGAQGGFTGYTIGYSSWGTGCYGASCFGGCYGATGGCYGIVADPVRYAPVFAPSETQAVIVGTPVNPTANPPAPKPALPPVNTDKVNPKLPDLPALPGLPGEKKAIDNNSVSIPNAARVIVRLPADARLWVDQVACPLQGDTRAFNTPALITGAHYSYNLTIETPQGNRLNRQIVMIPGQTVEVDFNGEGTQTVQK